MSWLLLLLVTTSLAGQPSREELIAACTPQDRPSCEDLLGIVAREAASDLDADGRVSAERFAAFAQVVRRVEAGARGSQDLTFTATDPAPNPAGARPRPKRWRKRFEPSWLAGRWRSAEGRMFTFNPKTSEVLAPGVVSVRSTGAFGIAVFVGRRHIVLFDHELEDTATRTLTQYDPNGMN